MENWVAVSKHWDRVRTMLYSLRSTRYTKRILCDLQSPCSKLINLSSIIANRGGGVRC